MALLSKNFSDSITHSRAGNATMVDSDGLLKWAPHNLLTYSEQFDNAVWSLGGTADKTSTTSPDSNGGNTALYLTNLQDAVNNRVYRSLTLVDGEHTFEVGLKGAAGETVTIEIDASAYQVTLTADFVVYSVSQVVTAGAKTIRVINRAGDTADAVYVEFAHLYRSDLGGMVNNPDRGDSYVPTTSSAVYLPRRGHHVYNGSAWVNEGLLHESEQRVNLVAYSDFSSAWGNFNGTITPNSEIGIDGKLSAATLVENTATGLHQFQNLSIVGDESLTYTASVVVSLISGSADRDLELVVFENTNISDFFRLTVDTTDWTGTTRTTGAASVSGYTIEEVVDGKYRISVTGVPKTGGANTALRMTFRMRTGGGNASYTGDGNSGFVVELAQLEAGSTPSSYIPTSGATVTRAAETLTIPSANLPWPEPVVIGDELVTNGTFDEDTSGWSETRGNGTLSWDAGRAKVVAAGAPDVVIAQAITGLTTGSVYRVSADIDSGTMQTSARLRVSTNDLLSNDNVDGFVFSGGGAGSDSVIFVATQSTHYVGLFGASDGAGDTAYLDNISVREINPLSVSIQMDGLMTYADDGASIQSVFSRWTIDANSRIETRLDTNSTASGQVSFLQTASGTSDLVNSSITAYSPDILVPFNIASRHGSTFINGAVDGVALTADTTPVALPDLSATDLKLGYDFMGTIKLFRIWADDLGDTGLEQSTS